MKRQRWILVVEDDASVREMLARVLIGEGYGVLRASNGGEAINVIKMLRVDLVLLDLNLPGKNGWEIFASLMELEPLLPVVILTARPNQLFTALGAGVAALLEKPLDFPVLIHTIHRVLEEPPAARLERLRGRPAHFDYRPVERAPLS